MWSIRATGQPLRLRAGLGGCPYIIFRKEMERETGIEPATSSLGSWRSTAELLPPGGKTDGLTSNPTKV
jgi:hypothetical protein